MKIKYEKKHFRDNIFIFLVGVALILVYKTVDSIEQVFSTFGSIVGMLMPFIIGFAIAYLLNPAVKQVENNLLTSKKKRKHFSKRKRLMSVLLVYVVFIGLISWIITYILPSVVSSAFDLISRTSDYQRQIMIYINNISERYEFLDTNQVNTYIDRIATEFDIFQNIELFLGGVMQGVLDVTTGILSLLLAIILGFYFLLEKENFANGIKRILRALLKDNTVDGLLEFGVEVDRIFSNFIIGKSIDSLIIGIICFLGLLIMNVKYALIISIIIGITNMIPYFGPYIGAVPAVIIAFFTSPIKALWVLIFIIILQQFDGMVLGPKILGESTGLSPVWIIFAITVGGGFFGIVGMFLGVPVVAVLRVVVNKFIDGKLIEKDTIKLKNDEKNINKGGMIDER